MLEVVLMENMFILLLLEILEDFTALYYDMILLYHSLMVEAGVHLMLELLVG